MGAKREYCCCGNDHIPPGDPKHNRHSGHRDDHIVSQCMCDEDVAVNGNEQDGNGIPREGYHAQTLCETIREIIR